MTYLVKRTKRKTLAIKILPDLTVTVYAPLNASIKSIEDFIEEHKNWILKHLNNFNNKRIEYKDFYDKKLVYFLGEVQKYNDNYYHYYKNYAQKYITDRALFLAKTHNFDVNSIKIKPYKHKWGCCDCKSNVSFNEKLILVDKNLIDYVIFHELCHTVHLNHGKEFYNLLEKFSKEHKPFKKILSNYAFLLLIDYNNAR